jgi:UDP-glucuronate 4-epimerase
MAYFKFVKAIAENKPIDVYNFGKMQRDFTYIDDVIEGVVRVMEKPPLCNSQKSSTAPYKIYNIGNNSPVELLTFIEVIEAAMGKTAVKNLLPMQPGDVPSTYADVDDLMKDVGFKPATPIEAGIDRFVQWYRDYYCNSAENSSTEAELINFSQKAPSSLSIPKTLASRGQP